MQTMLIFLVIYLKKMMFNFCTLFDSSYLTRGVAMYESLLKHCDHFHLFIFAFDQYCYKLLTTKDLPNVTVISLKDFENEELLRVKETRTKGEYCWTCTPHIIKYCLSEYALEQCTYLDADIYFYGNPITPINSMGANSILITPHRYTKEYDQSVTSGVYCVQFMTFKNTFDGFKALNWWADRCIEWCYARVEDGKFGDQKYLDDWIQRFKGVYVENNIGIGVAPWNIQQYEMHQKDNALYGTIDNGKPAQVSFYHFHNLKILSDNLFSLGTYDLTNLHKKLIYKNYINHLLKIAKAYNINHNEQMLKPRLIDLLVRCLKSPSKVFKFLKNRAKLKENIITLQELEAL